MLVLLCVLRVCVTIVLTTVVFCEPIDLYQELAVSQQCIIKGTAVVRTTPPHTASILRTCFRRSLTNHIHLAELIKATTESVTFRNKWQTERSMIEGETRYEILEDLIACQYPPYRILRLLCLQSLCGGGIKSSRYDSLRRDVVQTYG